MLSLEVGGRDGAGARNANAVKIADGDVAPLKRAEHEVGDDGAKWQNNWPCTGERMGLVSTGNNNYLRLFCALETNNYVILYTRIIFIFSMENR